ncbi:hypothetical protein ADK67_32245 [Saccharothrix sp. NRRL B-16348]|nr:hypothetical protein ADK67_32245 [Saccharothrix sp. NRRL B-16348]
MFGGEMALRLYFDALAFADGCEQLWREDIDALRSRGAFAPTGVTGAVEHVLGHRADDVVSSVYAEIAHVRTWLVLDQPLTPARYDRLRDAIEPWCAQDRSHSDVLAEFGPPSVLLGGSNPLYPKTFAYGTANPDDPLVFLHLWNGTAPGSATSWPPDHAEPQLLAARCGGATFRDGFSFTPRGATGSRSR